MNKELIKMLAKNDSKKFATTITALDQFDLTDIMFGLATRRGGFERLIEAIKAAKEEM